MNFDYSEEQQLLANSLKQFMAKDYTFEARKAILTSSTGYSEQVWSTFAEMGLLGLPFASELGGFGGNAVDLMPVMEAIGEGLVLEPYLTTVGLGGQFVARGGSKVQKQAILSAIIEGRLKLAFAQDRTRCTVQLGACSGTGPSLGMAMSLMVRSVWFSGADADKLVVLSARTAGIRRRRRASVSSC